jgi:hypothetical protein
MNCNFRMGKSMKKILYCLAVLLMSAQALAYQTNVPGESAHVLGGAIIAGATTAVADKFWPEHRALIGFSVSFAVGIIGESFDRFKHDEQYPHIFEDIVFNTAGAAIGALITDKFILSPVIVREKAENPYYGLALWYSF